MVVRKMRTRLTSSHGIRLAISSLALCVASSAVAQGSLERGKTAAQLYAANCAKCHKSPQSVTKTTGSLELETFLGVHYAATPKSAAAIATYLKGLEKRSTIHSRATKRTSQADAAERIQGQICGRHRAAGTQVATSGDKARGQLSVQP